jgi:hypothetical protein
MVNEHRLNTVWCMILGRPLKLLLLRGHLESSESCHLDAEMQKECRLPALPRPSLQLLHQEYTLVAVIRLVHLSLVNISLAAVVQ